MWKDENSCPVCSENAQIAKLIGMVDALQKQLTYTNSRLAHLEARLSGHPTAPTFVYVDTVTHKSPTILRKPGRGDWL